MRPAPRPATRPQVVLATCCLSLLMVMMDATIVNVVLPAIEEAFAPTASTDRVAMLQWVVDAYSLMVASGLMLGGSLADRFGRRRIFMIGIVVFCAGSALCGLATGPWPLVTARALQGAGGAMLNPVALSIVANVFTDARARARAIGQWGAMSGLALGIGPLVGGLLSAHMGWRSVFWVNLPLGAAALVLCWRFVPESLSPTPRRIDVTGQILAAGTLVLLITGLIAIPHDGWHAPLVLGTLLASTLSGIAFAIHAGRAIEPMIELRHFRSVSLSSALLIAILAFAIFSGLLFLNSLYLQHERGFSALDTGLCTLPLALGVVVCAPVSGWLVSRFGARPSLLLAGATLGAGALMLTPLQAHTPLALVMAALGLCGCGFGTCNAPITNAAVAGLPRSQAGMAAAMASTSRVIGTALGVAISGSAIADNDATLPAGAARDIASLSHPVWWMATLLSAMIMVLGILATGTRAQPSQDPRARQS